MSAALAGLLIGIFAAGAYLQARGLLPGILKHWPDIVYLSRQHLDLVAISGGIAIAMPPEIATRSRCWRDRYTMSGQCLRIPGSNPRACRYAPAAKMPISSPASAALIRFERLPAARAQRPGASVSYTHLTLPTIYSV